MCFDAEFNYRTPPALPAAHLLPGWAGGGHSEVLPLTLVLLQEGLEDGEEGQAFCSLLLSDLGNLRSASPGHLLAQVDKKLVQVRSGSWSLCLSLVLFSP